MVTIRYYFHDDKDVFDFTPDRSQIKQKLSEFDKNELIDLIADSLADDELVELLRESFYDEAYEEFRRTNE